MISCGPSTLTDYDGNIYKTVKIGNQIWIKENLNVSKFRNGDIIPEVKSKEEWVKADADSKPVWCYYQNDPANGKKYGKLYNWFAVNDSRGLSPFGWHIPTDAEWTTLTSYLSGDKVAGGKLKSAIGWDGTNESGLTALPAGGFDGYSGSGNSRSGGNDTSYGLNEIALFWSTAEGSSTSAWGRSLFKGNNEVSRFRCNKTDGVSVRCIKDN